MAINYEAALSLLEALFDDAEKGAALPSVPTEVMQAIETLVASSTQSYREALLGAALARRMDRSIDITLPYMNMGDGAFNGRTLDEQVINPLLKEKMVPSSKGPYLASFRRSVKLVPETAAGLRDKEGYAAMLVVIDSLKAAGDDLAVENIIRHLVAALVWLRDRSIITLARINRLSLPQLNSLISRMLATQSGGRFPVLLAGAMLRTLKKHFNLPWDIKLQGINAADAAAKSGGDIDILNESTGGFVFSIEITERVIDRRRVVSTFTSKISPHSISDYLFFYSTSLPEPSALEAAKQYFAQGHDISFLEVREWLLNCLSIVGPEGRTLFTNEFVDALGTTDIPSHMKVLWNDLIRDIGV